MGLVPLDMDLLTNLWTHVTALHVFAIFGVIALSYLIVKALVSIFKGLYSPYLGRLLGKGVDLTKLGQWAVITGASDGIGKAYVEELARLGLNIVLVSRTYDKLKVVADAVASEFKVKTKIVCADFNGGQDVYDSIRSQLEGLDIAILVNNVGMSYSYPEYLTEIPNGDETVFKLIHVNCISCTMMCRIVLPNMAKRGKGVILNLSSGASVLPLPFLSVYSAAKIFVDHLSQSLNLEYAPKGVIIQSVVPYYVATNMSKIRQTSITVPSPTSYVRSQLQTIGLENRTYGYLPHKIQGFLFEFLRTYIPPIMYLPITVNTMLSTRNRYLERKEKFSKNK